MVVEAHNAEDLHSEWDCSVPGHMGEVDYFQAAHVVEACSVLEDSKEEYSVLVGYLDEEIHLVTKCYSVAERKVASHLVLVSSAEEYSFVVAPCSHQAYLEVVEENKVVETYSLEA